MRALLASALFACLTLLSSAPADAQSGRASGSARGTIGGALGSGGSRAMPATRGTATGVLSGGSLRGAGGAFVPPGVRIRIGSTAPPIPYYSPYDPYYWHYDPYRYDRYRPGFATGRLAQPRRASPRHFFVAGFHFPLIYYYPVATTRVVHVQSDWIAPDAAAQAPPPGYAPGAGALVEACAIVTVLQPGHRGFWRRLQLPVAGARNADELQRVLDARIEEGVAFEIRDATGESFVIPERANLDRVVVHPCR